MICTDSCNFNDILKIDPKFTGCVIDTEGDKAHYLNGELHRTEGPAVEFPDGSKFWYLNGLRHRTDGPAYERPDGYKAWYLNGKEISEREFKLKFFLDS